MGRTGKDVEAGVKMSYLTGTLPRGAVDVAISRTKESPSVAGAATEIGLVPRTGCKGRREKREWKMMSRKKMKKKWPHSLQFY